MFVDDTKTKFLSTVIKRNLLDSSDLDLTKIFLIGNTLFKF